MSDVVARAPRTSRRLELTLVAMVVIVDQVTKATVRGALPLHGSITVIPELLSLTHVRNTGAAFGVLNNMDFPYKTWVIAAVALAALVGIALYASQLPPGDRGARVGLGLILGGAVGNLIDRATYGYVLDFVDAYWDSYHFWAFNVADSAISIGAVLLILDMMRPRRHVSHPV